MTKNEMIRRAERLEKIANDKSDLAAMCENPGRPDHDAAIADAVVYRREAAVCRQSANDYRMRAGWCDR